MRESYKIINRLSGLDPNGIDSEELKEDNLMLILINDLIKFDTDIKRVLDMSYKFPEIITSQVLNKAIYNYLSNIPLDTLESIEKAKDLFNLVDLTVVDNEVDNYIMLLIIGLLFYKYSIYLYV